MVTVPLNLDRLQCAVHVLCDLLTYVRVFFQSDAMLAHCTSGHQLPEPSNYHWAL